MSSPSHTVTQDIMYFRDAHSPSGWPTTPTKVRPLSSEVPMSKVAQHARKVDISSYNLNHPDFRSRLDGMSPKFANSLANSPEFSDSPDSLKTPRNRSPSPFNSADSPDSDQPACKIARPPNAFMLFRSWWLKKREIPEHIEKRQQQLSRVVGDIWRMLDESEKRQWHLKAEQRKDEHMKAHPGYRFIPSPRGSRSNKAKAQAMADDDETAAEKTKALRETYTKYLGPSPTPSRRKHAKKARRESESGIVPPSHWSAPSSTQPLPMPTHSSSTSFSGPYQNQNPMFFPQPQFTQDRRPSSSIGFFNDPQQYSFTDSNAIANQSINAFDYNIVNPDQNMVYGNFDATDLASQMNGLGIFGGNSPHIEKKAQVDIHQQLGGAFSFSTIPSHQDHVDNAQSFGLLPDSATSFTDLDMSNFMIQSPNYFASSTVGMDFQALKQLDYTFN